MEAFSHCRNVKDKKNATASDTLDNSEGQREAFRHPRDALLVLAATFIEKAKPRLKKLTKLSSNFEHMKIPELYDHKCYVVSNKKKIYKFFNFGKCKNQLSHELVKIVNFINYLLFSSFIA